MPHRFLAPRHWWLPLLSWLMALWPSSALALSQNYTLGDAILQQSGSSAAASSMPVRLNGTLGLPAGAGPFPVVLILHGRHPGCHFADPEPSRWPCPEAETRYDQGFSYLAESLAAAGYVVVIPNLNAAYSNTYGVTPANRNALTRQRSQQLVAAHLQQLGRTQAGYPTGFPPELSGRIDRNRLILIGHSFGGSTAARLAAQLNPPPLGLLLLAPTPSLPMTDTAAYALPDMPTSIWLGSCDRDIFDLSSLYYYEVAHHQPSRQQRVGAGLLLGANHNFFNAATVTDDYGRQPNDPACEPRASERLSRSQQMAFTQHYATAFVQTLLAPSPSAWASLGLEAGHRAPATLLGQPVLTNVTQPQSYRRLDWATRPQVQGGQLERCPLFSPCGLPQRYPSFPAIIRLRWRETGRLTMQLPSPVDSRPYARLQLRLSLRGEFPGPATLSSLSVVLRDAQNKAARVDIPLNHPELGPRYLRLAQSLSYPSSLRIPLAQFQGIDREQISAVELVFTSGAAGSLELADVGFAGVGQASSPLP